METSLHSKKLVPALTNISTLKNKKTKQKKKEKKTFSFSGQVWPPCRRPAFTECSRNSGEDPSTARRRAEHFERWNWNELFKKIKNKQRSTNSWPAVTMKQNGCWFECLRLHGDNHHGEIHPSLHSGWLTARQTLRWLMIMAQWWLEGGHSQWMFTAKMLIS